MDISLERIKRWGVKGGLSILDQGIYSGSNFVVSILLARWLSLDEFGAYAIGFTILTFISQVYVSFLLDPMSVLGTAHFSDDLKAYFAVQLRSHFVITIIAGAGLIVVGLLWVKIQVLVRQTLFVIGATLTLLLLPWYLRRVFYILGQPLKPMWGSLVYAIVLIALTVVSHKFDFLSAPLAVLFMAIAGLCCSIYLFGVFGLSELSRTISSFSALMRQNWNFGKWLVASSIFIAFASQVQIWISAGLLGLSVTGALRALQITIQPMMLTITALTALVTPAMSFEFSNGNFKNVHRKALLLSISLLILALIFEIFLLIFRIQLEMLVYDGKFIAYVSLIPVWGIVPVILAYSSGLQASFQAAHKPQALLIAAVLWAIASFGLGIWLTPELGVFGITWSAVIGYLIFAVALATLYRNWIYLPFVYSKYRLK